MNDSKKALSLRVTELILLAMSLIGVNALTAPTESPARSLTPHATGDMDLAWGRGPQMLFVHPAAITRYDGWGLSYDFQAPWSIKEPTSQASGPQDSSRHQLGWSLPLSARHALGLGWRGQFGLDDDQDSRDSLWTFGYQVKHRALRLGLSASWGTEADPIDSSIARHSGWAWSIGGIYALSSWLSISLIGDRLTEFSLTRGDLRGGLALRPVERWELGASARPFKGGGAWRVSTRWRIWRGLGVDLSFERAQGERVTDGGREDTLALGLSWSSDSEWRLGATHAGEIDAPSPSQLTLNASMRFHERAPAERALSPRLKIVVLPINTAQETLYQKHLLKSSNAQAPLMDTLLALEDLSRDPLVEGVLLILNAPDLGWAQAEELRTMIHRLRSKGKWVYSFIQNAQMTTYMVATATEAIWISPTGTLNVSGLLKEQFYLKSALDQLKITAEFLTVGAYKSAPETFTREAPSEEASKVDEGLLDARFEALTAAIAERTGTEEAKALINRGPYSAQTALKVKLVDSVVQAIDLETELRRRYKVSQTQLVRYSPSVREERWTPPPELAVLYGVGTLGAGLSAMGSENTLSASSMVPLIRKVARDPNIKGVLLRIDSPGGVVNEADEIWRALSLLAQSKPLVVSMGNVAASGGYYIAAPAHRIFASNATLTGSIGVFAGKVNLSQLLETLGIHVHRQRRGEGGGALSLFTPWSETQRAHLKRALTDIYDLFLERVLAGRAKVGLTRKTLLPLAGGRVWTGAEAQRVKLVDELGGAFEALEWLREETGLSDRAHRIQSYFPSKPSLFDQINTRAQGPQVDADWMADLADLQLFSGFASLISEQHVPTVLSKRPLLGLVSALPEALRDLFSLMIGAPERILAYAPGL